MSGPTAKQWSAGIQSLSRFTPHNFAFWLSTLSIIMLSEAGPRAQAFYPSDGAGTYAPSSRTYFPHWRRPVGNFGPVAPPGADIPCWNSYGARAPRCPPRFPPGPPYLPPRMHGGFGIGIRPYPTPVPPVLQPAPPPVPT